MVIKVYTHQYHLLTLATLRQHWTGPVFPCSQFFVLQFFAPPNFHRLGPFCGTAFADFSGHHIFDEGEDLLTQLKSSSGPTRPGVGPGVPHARTDLFSRVATRRTCRQVSQLEGGRMLDNLGRVLRLNAVPKSQIHGAQDQFMHIYISCEWIKMDQPFGCKGPVSK